MPLTLSSPDTQALAEHFDVPMVKDAAKTLQLPIKLLFPAGVRFGVQTYHMLGLGNLFWSLTVFLFLCCVVNSLTMDMFLNSDCLPLSADFLAGDMAIPGLFLALALGFDRYLEDEHRRKDGNEGSSEQVVDKISLVHGDRDDDARASTSLRSLDRGPSSGPKLRADGYFNAARWGYVAGIGLSIGASRIYDAAQPALLYLVPCVIGPLVWRARERNHLGLLWGGFYEPDSDDETELEDKSGDLEENGSASSGLSRVV